MKLDINPRGNGACPLCSSLGDCRLRRLLSGSVGALDGRGADMEIVVYSCPYFAERA